MWIQILIQLGLYGLKLYAKNTDTKFDDKVLQIAKETVSYLAPKINNTITKEIAREIRVSEMIQTQKSR